MTTADEFEAELAARGFKLMFEDEMNDDGPTVMMVYKSCPKCARWQQHRSPADTRYDPVLAGLLLRLIIDGDCDH